MGLADEETILHFVRRSVAHRRLGKKAALMFFIESIQAFERRNRDAFQDALNASLPDDNAALRALAASKMYNGSCAALAAAIYARAVNAHDSGRAKPSMVAAMFVAAAAADHAGPLAHSSWELAGDALMEAARAAQETRLGLAQMMAPTPSTPLPLSSLPSKKRKTQSKSLRTKVVRQPARHYRPNTIAAAAAYRRAARISCDMLRSEACVKNKMAFAVALVNSGDVDGGLDQLVRAVQIGSQRSNCLWFSTVPHR